MSDTPRTDEDVRLCRVKSSSFGDMVGADFARQLERENNQLRAELELARKCVEALREIGDVSFVRNPGGVWPKIKDIDCCKTSLAAYDQFKSRKGGEAE